MKLDHEKYRVFGNSIGLSDFQLGLLLGKLITYSDESFTGITPRIIDHKAIDFVVGALIEHLGFGIVKLDPDLDLHKELHDLIYECLLANCEHADIKELNLADLI